MAIGTVVIAFCPSYATIGVAAPVIVLVGRLLQGFSAGVELGGVSVYLSEIATPGNRGFYTSFQSSSQQVAIFIAAIIGYALSEMMPAATVAAWGWRIPFFIGCLIIPFIFVLRRTLEETPEFLAMKKHPSTKEVFASAAINWKIILLGMMLAILHYEWVHYVAHIPYQPRTRLGRWIKQYHLRHHFISEKHWFGVSNPALDGVFGTFRGPAVSEKSATTRKLHS